MMPGDQNSIEDIRDDSPLVLQCDIVQLAGGFGENLQESQAIFDVSGELLEWMNNRR